MPQSLFVYEEYKLTLGDEYISEVNNSGIMSRSNVQGHGQGHFYPKQALAYVHCLNNLKVMVAWVISIQIYFYSKMPLKSYVFL